jgi:ABC-2 type transport system permease protein
MIAALMRPRLLSFKNRWRTSARATRLYRDVAVLTLSLTLMVGMYRGTTWGVLQFQQLPLLVHLPIAIPLGLLLAALAAMSIISALSHAIGHIYLADDLDLLLAAPATSQQLFFARFMNVSLSVAWMPFIFILPVLVALGTAYEAPALFYILAPVILLPYFVIPSALATLAATAIMSVIDPRWTRALVVAGVFIALAAIYSVADSVATVFTTRNDPDQILRILKTISAAHTPWLPSTWAASALSEILTPSGKSISLRIGLLYSSMVTAVTAACAITNLVHGYAYTKSRNSSRSTVLRGRLSGAQTPRRFTSPTRAILTKEFRMIFRDLAQSSQVIFLAGLCILYLTNLRLFLALDSFPAESRTQWQAIFLIMHAAITAFFTTSLCTRLVFSSVSLEGRHFWILQTSPLPIRALLESKCLAWFIPISTLSALLFATGVFLIVGRAELVVLYTALSFFITYGIVGLGIGLGALFADFTWEHPSQLALSFGSFIYMLCCAGLIMLNIFPLAAILRLSTTISNLDVVSSVFGMLLLASLLIILNTLLARGALRLGERKLVQGEE